MYNIQDIIWIFLGNRGIGENCGNDESSIHLKGDALYIFGLFCLLAYEGNWGIGEKCGNDQSSFYLKEMLCVFLDFFCLLT